MFQKGDFIIYENSGVCRVEDNHVSLDIASAHKGKLYYKLIPVYGTGTIFIPVDTSVYMRPIITKEQALELISKIPEIKEATCNGMDFKALEEHYRASIKTHECEDLVQLIKTIYKKKVEMNESGKKPGRADVQYMKQAESLLHGELSIALDVPIDEVPGMIEEMMG